VSSDVPTTIFFYRPLGLEPDVLEDIRCTDKRPIRADEAKHRGHEGNRMNRGCPQGILDDCDLPVHAVNVFGAVPPSHIEPIVGILTETPPPPDGIDVTDRLLHHDLIGQAP